METYFLDEPGEYWVAAGIAFTSFEMIDAFALVTVAFGVDLQIGLLGTCAMTLPTGAPEPIAYVEIDIVASFTPSSGLLSVQGKLSPASFLYGGFCKLSGGFAFFVWFSGEDKGQFVVSLGGYHPAFKPPPQYPVVPRLTMAFGLGPFQVTGQAYFALTPAMMMAGLSMSATWSSGGVSAWLDAGIDFLFAWAPFHYEADAYINVGCSVDLGLLTLRVQIGADLQVWGPEFGGTAELDLDVVTCTIRFGAARSSPPPVGWDAFRNGFLPKDSGGTKTPLARQARRIRGMRAAALRLEASAAADAPTTNIVKASVAKGLAGTDVGGFDWIVDPNGFQIVTNSTIPSNDASWATSSTASATVPNTVSSYGANLTANGPYLLLPAKTFSDTLVWNPTIDIAAMNQTGVASYHAIALCKRSDTDPAGTYSDYVTTLSAEPILDAASAALWGPPGSKQADAAPLVLATLSGFSLTPIPRAPVQVNAVPLVELLFTDTAGTGFDRQSAWTNPAFTVSSSANKASLTITVHGGYEGTFDESGYVLSALANDWVTAQRDTLLNDLLANGFTTFRPAQIDVAELATHEALTDWPEIALLAAEVAA